MDNIRNSNALKILSYILIPILVALLGLSIFHMVFLEEYGVSDEQTDYTQTENFADNYLYFFTDKVRECTRTEQGNNQGSMILEDNQGNSYYFLENQSIYSYYDGIEAYIEYVIMDRENRKDVY